MAVKAVELLLPSFILDETFRPMLLTGAFLIFFAIILGAI
jgi:hypothetical protein